MDYLTTRTSLSPIRRWFAPGFVNYKKGCTRLTTTSDEVYQLLAHGRWFSLGTPASSITKIGRHVIAEILLKVALSTKNQSINNPCSSTVSVLSVSIHRLVMSNCITVDPYLKKIQHSSIIFVSGFMSVGVVRWVLTTNSTKALDAISIHNYFDR